MAQRIAGIAFVHVDGKQYPLRGNFTVSPSRTEKAGIAGQDRVHGYSELPRVPFIAGTISMIPELSLDEIDAWTDATVTAELASGHNYVLRNAWTAEAREIATAEGEVAVRWEGMECVELMPQAA